MRTEAKTGQRSDIVKECLLSPILVEKILQTPILEREEGLSIIDIGTGDASYCSHVINQLVERGVRVEDLALVDADTSIFPDLLATALVPDMPPPTNVQVVETRTRSVVQEFLRHHREQYDVAISQLVLHQIPNDSEMSYLVYMAYQALKSGGVLFLVDLHPEYIRFLMEHEPTKFGADSSKERLEGKYHFDSGGSVTICSREIVHLLSVMVGIGFDLVDVSPILPEAIADKKERYRELVRRGVPMFYIMQLEKSKNSFVSGTEGVVKHMQPYQENGLHVVFIDEEEIIVPRFGSWEDVKPYDYLVLQEIRRLERNIGVLNCWVIPNHLGQETGRISWDQMVFNLGKTVR